MFIDARSQNHYQAGHIPGSLNLSVSNFEISSHEVLKGLPKNSWIITYCSGSSCQSSIHVARMLIEKHGYTRTQAFYEGWSAWKEAGYPFVIGESP